MSTTTSAAVIPSPAASTTTTTTQAIIPIPATTTTTSTTTTTQATVPTVTTDPASSPDPSKPTTSKAGKTTGGVRTNTTADPTSSAIGTGPTQASGSNGNGNGNSNGSSSSAKSVIGPAIGGVAAVLVLAFLIGVFMMRYKKKNKARKRRLDFLEDHHGGSSSGTALSGAALSGAALGGAGAAAASHSPASTQNAALRPSTPAGGRPLEMAAVGASAAIASNPHNEGYDYQQGYQQVPYNGYPEQYNQYDPYYAQRQQQAQGYYADQQQGYYPEGQHYQNQFAPPAPVGINSQGTSSPSMTHATASPKSYPQPPLSTTTGGHSSPHTPLQSTVPAPGGGIPYEKNAMAENGYAGSHSPARNPQLVPEHEDRIKVPV
ncbi:hypothetical protein BGZ58_009713 [Dissophora ornata]|nr:hypothetical protein BGZ58_009713 [Dissophora ornata]